MNIFHHAPHLGQPDPLGDGVADDIAKEREEPEHFTLEDQLDSQLVDRWERTIAEMEKLTNRSEDSA